jgi:hypothetical protein
MWITCELVSSRSALFRCVLCTTSVMCHWETLCHYVCHRLPMLLDWYLAFRCYEQLDGQPGQLGVAALTSAVPPEPIGRGEWAHNQGIMWCAATTRVGTATGR